jgi:hypothetical protein
MSAAAAARRALTADEVVAHVEHDDGDTRRTMDQITANVGGHYLRA